jgi:adenosine deaminase
VLLRRGVPISISTDDTTISDVTLSEELLSCVELLGLSVADIWRCNMHALDAAFVDERTRALLQKRFRSWAATIPEVN